LIGIMAQRQAATLYRIKVQGGVGHLSLWRIPLKLLALSLEEIMACLATIPWIEGGNACWQTWYSAPILLGNTPVRHEVTT